MDYKQKYEEALERAKMYQGMVVLPAESMIETIFPELAESEDELTWLTKYIEEEAYSLSMDIRDNEDRIKLKKLQKALAWLEKQGTSYTKRDVDDAYVEGMAFAKGELEKQKPAWSVEDTFKVQRICKYLDEAKKYYADITEVRDCINWLKSLKDRVQPKQEWSKEDKERFISCLKRLGSGNPEQPETINSKWFKEHVFPQNTWKPNKEQLHLLHWIANIKLGDSVVEQEVSKHLNKLYEDLKKLKEE